MIWMSTQPQVKPTPPQPALGLTPLLSMGLIKISHWRWSWWTLRPLGWNCHDPQCSGACQTYFPWPQTRHVDPGSILAEQCTMPDEATKVGMWNTDAHICAPSLFSSQRVYIYPTSTGNFPSLEIN